jgi:amino acid transporter
MCQACFSYTGTEVVGMAFGETPNPRENVPRAIRQTFWRIFLFYVLAVLAIGMAVPYNSTELLTATSKSTSAGEYERYP